MPLTQWVPSETRWSDSAHRETKAAYPEQADDRKVALCIWMLAANPNATLSEIEQHAEDDASIEARSESGKKINSNHLRQARKVLGLPTSSKKRSSRRAKSLSKIEKAILARFNDATRLLEAYVKQVTALADAQQAFNKARAALVAMPREQAETLAEVDPKAAEILASVGALPQDDDEDEPAARSPNGGSAVWPSGSRS